MKQLVLTLLMVVPALLAAQSIIASDNFNRPNESPFAVGGNWQRTVAGPFDGSSNLTSGRVSGADSEGIYYWQGAGTFDNTRQFARATIVQGSGEAGLVLLGGSNHAIMVSWGPPNAGGTVYIFWYDGPGETGSQLATASSTVQSGDVIEALLDEGTIYAKVNGSIVASVANTTTLTSGTPGFQTYLTGATLDNWEAGTPAPIYTISGTITEGGPGLAGVLVTASGGFTGSTTTDGTGAYTVAGVPSGATSIVLTPTLAGHVMSPLTRTVNGPVTSNVSGEDFTSTINTYTLTVNATNGTVAKDIDQPTYSHGTNVILTPTGASGYHFVSWSGDAIGSSNPLTVTMDGNKTITANFGTNSAGVIASDNFNRADETPLAEGGNWQRILTNNGAGNGTVNLAGNRIVGVGGEALYHWQGAGAFSGARQYTRATVVQPSGQLGLLLLGATGQAIVASWGGGTLFVYWYSGGLYQGSLTTASSTLQAGDIIEAVLDGGIVHVKVNGSIISSVSNTTTLSSGRPGFETFQSGAILDNWEAGTPPVLYSLSGAILENSNPLSGVTVAASSSGFSGSAITNAGGVYTFIAVPESSVNIILTPSLSGHTFSPATRTVTGPVVANVTAQDFTSTRNLDVVSDDFNRADETPFVITGNWRKTTAGTPGSANLSSNQVVGNGGEALYRWNGTFSTTSQFARATVVNAGGQVGLTLLGGSDQTIVVSWSGGTLFIYRYVGGIYQGNLGTVSSTLQNGDVIEAVLDAGTIRAKRNGVVLLSVTNSTGISSGSPGIETFGTGGILDNFEAGGALVYTLTASAGTNGAISPNGVVNVNHGGSQSFTITPATGYHVDSLLVDNVKVDSTTSYTFVNITGNHTIRAVFRINQYAITASAGTNGAISPSGAVNVNHGASQAFTITPATGYHVDSLLVDNVKVDSTTSYTFVNVTGPHTIRAVFRINQYTLTASAGANGAISPSGVVNVNHGGNQSFTIIPATGYHVDSLLVDDVKVDSTTSYTFVNVTEPHTIRAVFRINQYTLTASAGTNGAISPSGAVNVNHGGSQSFTITPATGYHVDSLLVDNVKVDSTTSYTFVNVTGNHAIRAVFRINQYTIAASAGTNGAISPNGTVSVNHGGNQAFTIIPATGYHVDSLLVDDVKVDSTTSYTFVNVTEPHTIRAVFRINQYTLTASAGANGAISPSGAVNVNHGGNQSFTITPVTGYHVDSLLVDDVKVDSTTGYTFVNVTGNHSIRSVFRINQYTLTASAGANGSISPSGAVSVNHGGNQSFTITPVTGYHVDSLLVDNVKVDSTTSFTFTNVTTSHTIRAVFRINQYTLTVNATHGTVLKIPDQPTYGYGTNVQLTAVPAVAFYFANWSGSVPAGHETDNPLMLVMDQDRAVTANFVTPHVAINPVALFFGDCAIPHGRVDTLVVKNTGDGALTIASMVVNNVAQFSVLETAPLTVQPGDSTKIRVAFHPTSVGIKLAHITFTHNGSTSPDIIDIAGNGVPVTFAIAPDSLWFGDVFVTASRRDSVLVSNNSTIALTIDSVKSDNPEFVITPTSGSVAPSNTLKLYVTFLPGLAGLRSGKIIFYTNAISETDTLTVAGTGFTDVNVSVQIRSGWNIVSNPVTVTNDSVRTLYPASSFEYGFYFSGAYVQDRTMENGVGYWMKFPADTSQTLTGVPRTRDSITVATGWNMVGSISGLVDTSAIVSDPPGLKGSPWFGYAGGYTPATQLVPGQGYWIKSRGTGKFIFASTPFARIAATQTSDFKPLGEILNTLTITDSHGGSQTLYFGADANAEIPVSLYGMPPAPPVGAFDARFEGADGGSMVQTHAAKVSSATEFPVSILSNAYPVTVSWKVKNGTAAYELTDGHGGSLFLAKEMRGEGEFKISDNGLARFSVNLIGDGQLPGQYTLSQNYPNPFNPVTTIRYALPAQSHVTLKLYNLLGQEVATLVNDEQDAGYKSTEWNAGNTASGVYYYRLQAGNFVETRKLVLLR